MTALDSTWHYQSFFILPTPQQGRPGLAQW